MSRLHVIYVPCSHDCKPRIENDVIQDVFLNSYFKEVVLAEIAFGTQGRTLYIYGIHMYICHFLTQTWYSGVPI